MPNPFRKRAPNQQPVLALGRLPAGTKNKTEQAYEDEVLSVQQAAGEILWYCFEGMTFKLPHELVA